MSVQVVANLVDESILTNLPFLPENLGVAWRSAQNIFVPSGSYGQIWSLITAEESKPPVFIYDITSSNGDLRFKGSIGATSTDGNKYKGYGIYASNLDKILLTTTSTIYAFSSSVISAQSDGFLAPLGGATELSLISYSCSFRVNNNGEGVTNIGYAVFPNMFTYTPSASIGYYSVFSWATSSNGDAISISKINTPLSASIAALSSSGQNISGAANLCPLGFFMSTFDSNSPTNEIYVDLTTPLISSFGVPLDKILKGTYTGNTLTNSGQSIALAGTYNSDLNRIYTTVGFASGEIGVVELDNNTTPPTVISVITSSGILSIYQSDITYNNINKDFIILTSASPLSSQYKIIDASSTLNTSKFTSPKSTITLSGYAAVVVGQMLAISNSYYQSLPIRGYYSPLTTPFSSSLYFLNRIQSNSLGYNVTSQSFAKSYEDPQPASFYTFGMAHATSSNINKIITADRSNVGPIGNPDTYGENLTTTFARAGYIYSLDLTTLTTSSFFTPYTTQLNGDYANTSVIVSGSTDVGYKINIDNLTLYLDARNSNSYPGSGNIWYDLTTGRNNVSTTLATYDSTNPANFNISGDTNFINFTSSATGVIFTIETVIKSQILTDPYLIFLNNTFFYITFDLNNNIFYQTGGIVNASMYTEALTNEWQYFVFELHNNLPPVNSKLYRNGEELTQDIVGTGLVNYNNNMQMAGGTGVSCSMFRTYNRALTQQEITNNYNYYKPIFNLT